MVTLKDKIILKGEKYHGLFRLLIRMNVPEKAAEVYIAQRTEPLQVWHEKLGHQNKQYVERFLKQREIGYLKDETFCESCMKGKQHRKNFGTRERASSPGELVHTDICGPMSKDSIGKKRYFVAFTDDFSKYRHVYFLQYKSEVAQALYTYVNEAKTTGHPVKVLLSDNGKEFCSQKVQKICEGFGIIHNKSMPYTLKQNGTAERENRTLIK